MISTSTLSTAASNEHFAQLRRDAARPRVAREQPRNRRRLRIAAVAAVAAGLVLFASSSAWAVTSTYHASPTGSDSASCTDSDPCSLRHAIDVAPSGSQVLLAPGTYQAGSGAIQVDHALDIRGEDGQPAPTILNDHSACAAADAICLQSPALSIGPAEGSLSHVRVVERDGLANGTAIRLFNSADGVPEVFEGVFAQSDDGFAIIAQGDAILRDSVAWVPSSGYAAIGLEAPDSVPASVRLENVTAWAPGTSAYGLWVYAYCNLHPGCGVNVLGDNNIIHGGGTDILPESPSGNGIFSVGLSHSNYDVSNSYVTPTNQAGNQTDAPQFVNAAQGDFHELAGSPTVDAGGLNGNLGSTDLDGAARSFGSAPDIGAYEWMPAPNPPQQPQQPQQPQSQPQGTQPQQQSGSQQQSQPGAAAAGGFRGVRLRGGALRLRHGKLRLRVSCPKQASRFCKGRLTVTRGAHSSRVGSARFALEPGHSKLVRVRVARKLRSLRHFRAIARASARDAGGKAFSTRVRIRVQRG